MSEKISYQNIEKKLKYLDQISKKLSLQVIGQSANGENIYSITVSQDVEVYNKSFISKQYQQMIHHIHDSREPMLLKNPKIPIMITGSIHGFEYNGTDAIMNLIDYFIEENNPDVEEILTHCILLFIPSINPDGLKAHTRFNGNGFDLNRDFITQSQPETKAIVTEIVDWNPMVILDLHGYVNLSPTQLGIIEPCTPPHNANYHYDLFSPLALQQAEAIEKKLVQLRHTYSSKRYQKMTGTSIPLRDKKEGWDDFGPFTLTSYGILHGAISITLETPNQTLDGTRWHFDAVKEACHFIANHSSSYFSNLHKFQQRTIKGIPPQLKKKDYPTGYLLSTKPTSLYSLNKVIGLLTENGIIVKKVKENISEGSMTVPKGSYFVSVKQPKGLIANAFLEANTDLSNGPYKMSNLSTWSLPSLWGFHCIPIYQDIDPFLKPSTGINMKGKINGNGPLYKLSGSPIAIIKLVNKLLNLQIHIVRDDRGDYYVNDPNNDLLVKYIKSSGIIFESTNNLPLSPPLSLKKIVLLKDGGMYRNQSHAGTKQALTEMGFFVDELSPQDLAENGLKNYDTLIIHCNEYIYKLAKSHSDLNKPFVLQNEEQQNRFNHHIERFVEKGGNVIGIGAGGAKLAQKILKFRSIPIHTAGWNENGIVSIHFPESPLSFGYKELDQGFVYRPVWFTETPEVQVLARFENSPQFFISGYWKQKREIAHGQPVVIKLRNQKVFLIGLDLGYKMYPYHLFPLMASAIYY